jgi:hypothetical protein
MQYEEEDYNESDDEQYVLSQEDRDVVTPTKLLLWKVVRSRLVKPQQLEVVAKLLSLFDGLPKTADEMDVTLQLTGPRRSFGEHEIYHWWTIAVEGQAIEVSSGGHFYRSSTGGDTFTSMTWATAPGCDAEYRDYLDTLRIVDDAQPFDAEVDQIDLSLPGYSLEITLDGEEVGVSDEDIDQDGMEDDEERTVVDDGARLLKPDYGLMLVNCGQGNVLQCFYAVPLSYLSVSGPSLFTSMLNLRHDGVEYALSFDFGPKEIAAALSKAPVAQRRKFDADLRKSQIGDAIALDPPLVVDLEARPGEIQTGANEQFIPLVVKRVS